MTQIKFPFQTPYGYFSDDGASFVITRPDTPRPWMNVMSTGTYGVALSQTGNGENWLHRATNRISGCGQDLIRDEGGRALYLRDESSGKFWSVGWQPVRSTPASYEAIHGVGYSIINSENEGIRAQWLVFVPHDEPLEVWRLRLRNASSRPRRLTLWTYMEWNLGGSPLWGKDFHRSFIETSVHDKNAVILAKKRLSPLKNSQGQTMNRNWDHVAWHAVSMPPSAASCDKEAFLGNYGSLQNPAALQKGRYVGSSTHKWDDSIASVCVPLSFKAREEKSLLLSVGAADSQSQALVKARRYLDFSQVDSAWGRTESYWDKFTLSFTVKTPDRGFDLLTNTWLKYQALSGRAWGQSPLNGEDGCQGDLRGGSAFLPIDVEGSRKHIHLQAGCQGADGGTCRPNQNSFSEGHPSRCSEGGWLPVLLTDFLKETGHWSLLSEKSPFAKDSGVAGKAENGTLHEHGVRAIERVLGRFSRRGLPLMGEFDWNDGLSAVGHGGKGESVWMAVFLVGVLEEWAEMTDRAIAVGALPVREKKRSARYRKVAAGLRKVVNRVAWDGAWYWRATGDDGSLVGSRTSPEGKIYLDAQTWAVVNGVVPAARRRALLSSIEKYLYGSHGPALLAPPYTRPDERIGYVSRCAPGTRENGGICLQSAVGALRMECLLGRADKAWSLYEKISPLTRYAKGPDLFRAEPYAAYGNVNGPGAPFPGRAGSASSASAASWLFRVSTEWILGIRAEWDGLLVRPCLPPHWKTAEATRAYRGGTYRITFVRDASLSRGSHKISLNNRDIMGDLLPSSPGMLNTVHVRVGFSR